MKYTGVILVMLAAVCWGISGVIADILMNKGWNPIVISFYRGAIGLLFFSYGFSFALRKTGLSRLVYTSGLCWPVWVLLEISLSIF